MQLVPDGGFNAYPTQIHASSSPPALCDKQADKVWAAMATTTSNTHVKQIKASSGERINGKVKLQNNKADGGANANPANGTGSTTSTATASGHTSAVSSGKGGATTNGPAGESLSPEQRRRISGRPQMTTEEQRQAVRKKVPINANPSTDVNFV